MQMARNSRNRLVLDEVVADLLSSSEESGLDDDVLDPSYAPGNENSDSDQSTSPTEDDLLHILADMRVREEEEECSDDEGVSFYASLQDERIEWSSFTGRQASFPFTGASGIQIPIDQTAFPSDIFSLFVDDEVINVIVEETNRYADQFLAGKILKPSSRFQKWKPTSPEEMQMFLGLLLWMGLNRRGTISSYWSRDPIYATTVTDGTMSRNRFEILLKFIHFADNNQIQENDRLGKIQPLVELLQKKFQQVFCPGEHIVADETLVPWRSRLVCKQYIPNKAHKYGIKLFKLCSAEGFTYSMKVYGRKVSADGHREVGIAKKVCESLAVNLLKEGRTLFVDNFYTSYELARSFLEQQTHVVGTLRSNKKGIPKEIMQAKLKKGEMVSCEDENGIVVLKWIDTRDVRMLSTLHKPVLTVVGGDRDQDSQNSSDEDDNAPSTSSRRRSRRRKLKPEAVIAYNQGKTGIDFSDQMASYATTLRKGVKWFRKLGIELLHGMAIVNAFIIYNHVAENKIKIRSFRECVTKRLLRLNEQRHDRSRSKAHTLHTKKTEGGKKVRRACKICYAKIRDESGCSAARKKLKLVSTYCTSCPNEPFMCIECFGEQHK